MTYPLTSRGWTKGNTRIRVTCRRVNSDGDIVWTLPQDMTYSPVADGDMSVIDIFIPDNLDLPSFTVVCYVEGAGTKDFTLSGIREGQAAPIYGGVVQAGHLPENTTEGELFFGDHIIVENEDGTRDPYYWDGDRWVFFDGETPRSVAFMILQNVLWDGTSAPATEDTLSAINIFARNLATNTLFAFYAKIRNLQIGDGGNSLDVDIYDYSNGRKVTPVFRVRYGGKTIFQIDPATGNIFFGEPNSQLNAPVSGFMYDAAKEQIRSLNGKIVVDTDGTLHAQEADIEGSISATDGVFRGTLDGATGFFSGSLDTPSFSAMPNGAEPIEIAVSGNAETQVYTLDSAFADNSLTDGFMYRCTHPLNPQIKYVTHITSGGFSNPCFYFYAEDGLTMLGRIRRYDDFWMWIKHFESTWADQSFTITVYKGDGNVFRFKNLPTEANGLEIGQVWVDSAGVLHAVVNNPEENTLSGKSAEPSDAGQSTGNTAELNEGE